MKTCKKKKIKIKKMYFLRSLFLYLKKKMLNGIEFISASATDCDFFFFLI